MLVGTSIVVHAIISEGTIVLSPTRCFWDQYCHRCHPHYRCHLHLRDNCLFTYGILILREHSIGPGDLNRVWYTYLNFYFDLNLVYDIIIRPISISTGRFGSAPRPSQCLSSVAIAGIVVGLFSVLVSIGISRLALPRTVQKESYATDALRLSSRPAGRSMMILSHVIFLSMNSFFP